MKEPISIEEAIKEIESASPLDILELVFGIYAEKREEHFETLRGFASVFNVEDVEGKIQSLSEAENNKIDALLDQITELVRDGKIK